MPFTVQIVTKLAFSSYVKLCGHLFTEYFSNRAKVCKIGQNFVYVITYNMDFTAPIFTKFVMAEQRYEEILSTADHLKR
jgi:hypothetical protein